MHARSLFAVVVAALLASPAAASAQAKRGSTAPRAQTAQPAAAGPKALSLGGFVGWEMGDLDGFALRLDGEVPIQKLSPQVDLSGVGSLGISFLSHSVGGLDASATIFKVVPAARFTLPLNPQLSLFGDAGLGLYYASTSVEAQILLPTFPPTTQIVKADDSSVGFMLRFAAGGSFLVNPRMKLNAILQLDPMFGDFDDATFTILAGLMYAL